MFSLTGIVYAAEPHVIAVGGKGGITPQQALEEVAKQRAEHPQQAIDVVVADGVYELEQALVIEAKHSGTESAPVRWMAATGAKPVFSGGKKISGFTVQPDGLWRATLPDDIPAFEQMWVNGRRAQRARYPNQGFVLLKSVNETILSENKARQAVTMAATDLAGLAALDPSELACVQMLAYHKWDNTRRFLKSVEQNGSLTTEGRAMKSWNRWDAHTGVVFENYRAALDQAGEWFVDAKRVLYYQPRPGETIAQAEVIVPRLSQLLLIKGSAEQKVHDISWQGLRFLYTGWICPAQGFEPQQAAASMEAVIQADHGERLRFEACEIAHTGLYGLWFRRACTRNVVRQCLLHDLGAGGLRTGTMELPASPADLSKEQVFDNNIISAAGKVFPCAVGVWIGHSSDNFVSHNEISYLPYTAISVGWRWGYDRSEAKRNRIEFNHLHHIGDGMLSDMGAVYTLGPSEGTVISGNHIHDVISYTYGGWGLYNDEGSTGIVMENNLVHHTKSGSYHQHYGKDNVLRNNILAFASEQQLQYTRAEQHRSFTITGNIVLWEKGPLTGGGGWKTGMFDASRNLYWKMDGSDPGTLPRETDSMHANPRFANPAAGDWTLPADSPAMKIGFRPFDPRKAGLYGNAAWTSMVEKITR